MEFFLAPFSYAEFLEALNAPNSEDAFTKYLEFGGMPFLSEIGYRQEPARRYLQVAYLMPTEETRDREFSALRLVPDQFEKIVLSMDRFDFSHGGIKHLYLPDFLLVN